MMKSFPCWWNCRRVHTKWRRWRLLFWLAADETDVGWMQNDDEVFSLLADDKTVPGWIQNDDDLFLLAETAGWMWNVVACCRCTATLSDWTYTSTQKTHYTRWHERWYIFLLNDDANTLGLNTKFFEERTSEVVLLVIPCLMRYDIKYFQCTCSGYSTACAHLRVYKQLLSSEV